MQALLKDFRFGVRALLSKPGSAILSILAFGLGIGLCATMFSIIYGVFYRGIGVPDDHELALLSRTNPSRNITRQSVPQHDFFDWREQQQTFDGLAGYSTGTINVSGTESPERFDGAFVSANLFDVLQFTPVLGTTFRSGDDAAGAPLTAVLGYDVWETNFSGDSTVLGRTIKVNGEQATIIGVLPDGFMFPETEEIWIPQRDMRGENPERGTGPWFNVVGRLRDGVSVDEATQDMTLIAQRLAQAYPETNEGVGVVFNTFADQAVGDDAIPVFAAMQVATIFVLLIACANVANLLLARAALRTKEAALRSALGASKLRVALPFFTEALALSVVGALLGIGIAYVGVELFDRATTGVGKPYYMHFAVDLPILSFVLGITALTALASGAAPSFQIARTDVNTVLKDEGRGSSSFRAGKLSKVLVAGQVALSCALLVGAGLMTKSIVQLRNFDYSFDTEHIFTARIGLFETDYPTREARSRFFEDLKLRLLALPRVESAALTDVLPASGSGGTRFGIEGETYATDEEYPRAPRAVVSPDFFETFDVDVVLGRDFNTQDDADATAVAIVNQRFVEAFFPGQSGIGRRIREGTSQSEASWREIVGVVPNLQMEGFDPDAGDPAGFYVPLAQTDRSFLSIALRVTGTNPLAIAAEVREAVRAIDPDQPIYWVRDMPEVIRQETWFYHVFGSLFIIFGIAALFLASVGLYGVLAFSVSRRIQEMGIRMALGANALDVIRMVFREGSWQVGIGLLLGLALSAGVSNIVSIISFNVESRDPMVFGGIVLVIVIVAAIASLIPARRATRVDPMVALRYE